MKKTVFVNFSMGLAGRLFSQLFSFFIVVYLARVLGPADYGDISLALALVSYFNLLATFGLPTVGTREVACVQHNSQELVSRIFSLRIWLAVISYLGLFVYGYYFASTSRLFQLILLYGLAMLSASCFLDWYFVGMEDLQSLTIANVMGNLFSCGFTFLLVKNVDDIYYVPIISFLGSVISCFYLLYVYRKIQSLHFYFNIFQFRNFLRASTPFAITGVLSQIYGNMDMIFLGYWVGSEEVGYYSVAYKIVVVLSGVIGIYSQSTWPVMIRLFETNTRQAGEFLKQNLQTMLYFMIPVVTGGTILARNIIESFFGEVYAPAVIPFVLLLYYVFFMALSITLANLLLAVKKDKIYLKTLVLGAVTNVVANLVLIPQWRATGSASAMVIAELVVFIFLLSKVKALHNESWVDNKFIFLVMGSNFIMGVGILGIQQMFQYHVGVSILAGVLIYIGVSWPFCAKFIRRG